MTYGVQPTGFVRKPLSVILAEIEAAMVSEFGPGVVQTPQSPLGQVNGLFADLVAELWERNEDLYQSYDPDQAEGLRLDTLARLRLIFRAGKTEEEFRQAITNADETRVDLQDITRAIGNIPGVTYRRVFVNDSGEVDSNGADAGSVSVAAIGGADEDIARVLRRYIAPGVNTYGNHRVTAVVDGFCRTLYIVRPIDVPATLSVKVKLSENFDGCPPPSATAIRDHIVSAWEARRINGLDITAYEVRHAIENAFAGIEFVEFTATRDEIAQPPGQPLVIAFLEIASLSADDVNVTVTA